MVSLEEARRKIGELVETYDLIKRLGKDKQYNEPNVRMKFIEPLLEALGWEVRKGIDIVEAEQQTLTGPVDFALKVNGRTKIVFEIKKFAEDLDGYRESRGRKESYVEQAIRYAYHKNADWAVLTNFEEFRVYNVRWDVKTVEERLLPPFPLKYNEYLENFDKLWLLSKESVISGRLDEWIKKGLRSPIDREILNDLLKCRELLADDIHKHNKDLTSEELRECVQKILDRIVVIRAAEDRGIISAESLWVKLDTWKRTRISDTALFIRDLKEFFRQFDDVYNSKLFEEHKCEDLRISNEVLESIVNVLYKYNFDLIGADVLGSIYEDYIGHILREKGEKVEIVEERRRRKEAGIYYTPTYVVDYIVRNTLGDLLKNKTPEEVQKIKVLDPACGSGSFLIKAFDVFKEYYSQRQERIKEEVSKTGKITPFLGTIAADKEILTQNLYGVDLDEQAAEIASVNLMLKALKKGEKLPLILEENIKVGNSLISGTEDELKKYFEKPEEKKPFNWEEEFPEVFKEGGFDVVIGNPPYYNIQTVKDEAFKAWLRDKFTEIHTGQNDILYYFYHRGLNLLKEGGLLGLITSRYFMEAEFAEKLRKFIENRAKIRSIIDFGSKVRVFADSNVNTAILILERCDKEEERKRNTVNVIQIKNWVGTIDTLIEFIKTHSKKDRYEDKFISVFKIPQTQLMTQGWFLAPATIHGLLRKIESDAWSLGDTEDSEGITHVLKSIESGLDEIKVKSKKGIERIGVYRVDGITAKKLKLEEHALRKLIKNQDVRRYLLNYRDEYLIYLTDEIDINSCPNVKHHLERFKDKLSQRYDIIKGKYPWYRLSNLRNLRLLESRKDRLFVPLIAPENRFAFVAGEENFVCTADVYVVLPKDECPVSLKYILGILNSKLFNFYHKRTAKAVDGIARTAKGEMGRRYSYQARYIAKLPIKKIDFADPQEKDKHDSLVGLVDQMILLNKRLSRISTDFDRYLTEPIVDYVNLKHYYEKLDINDKEALDKSSKGTIKKLKVEEQNDWLVFKVDYIARKKKEKREFSNVEVLKCRFEDELLRKFLFYTIKNYKKSLGTGNLLYKILNIEIPCFDKDPDRNKQIIDKIMKEYLKAVEEKGQLESEIRETDDQIDIKVYELYGLTQEEISIVEGSIGGAK